MRVSRRNGRADDPLPYMPKRPRRPDLPPDEELRIPVAEEQVIVGKRRGVRGRLRIRLHTEERLAPWETEAAIGGAEVERVRIGREVDVAPMPRREGNAWVIPIVDEIPVVVKRLYLREELWVKMHRTVERRGGEIVLRQVVADIERLDVRAAQDTEEPSVTRKITAIFATIAAAERARDDLIAQGLPGSSVSILHGGHSLEADERKRHRGWFSALFGRNEDRATYEESLNRGEFLLTAIVDDRYADEAVRILEQSDALDLDERSTSTKATGDRSQRDMTGEVRAEANAGDRDGGGRSQGQVGSDSAAAVGSAGSVRDQDSMAFPVVEEQVAIGKREVERGGVRVRSYVVETPVEELVTLREQFVEVGRRPVNQRVAPGDVEAAFQDRDVVVTEHAEEPVVAKQAVVKEEVVVTKREAERAETVRDTVRRTEVDVDRGPGKDIPPGGGQTGGGQTS